MTSDEQRLSQQIGRTVRKYRTNQNWSQARLAEMLDVSVDFLGLLERGKRLPAVPTLARIAGVLGASAGELLGEGRALTVVGDPVRRETVTLVQALPDELLSVARAMLLGLASEARSRSGTRRRKTR